MILGHLRNVALLLRAQRSSRHKNCRIGGLMFDNINIPSGVAKIGYIVAMAGPAAMVRPVRPWSYLFEGEKMASLGF